MLRLNGQTPLHSASALLLTAAKASTIQKVLKLLVDDLEPAPVADERPPPPPRSEGRSPIAPRRNGKPRRGAAARQAKPPAPDPE
jgi:hypothetical protein